MPTVDGARFKHRANWTRDSPSRARTRNSRSACWLAIVSRLILKRFPARGARPSILLSTGIRQIVTKDIFHFRKMSIQHLKYCVPKGAELKKLSELRPLYTATPMLHEPLDEALALRR